MKGPTSAFGSNEYDKEIKCTLPYYEEFYKQIIDIVQCYERSPVTWLDIGCGTGKMAEEAMKKISIEEFVFCDSSQDMLSIAKQRFDASNTRFLCLNVQKITFLSEFDIITAIQVHHYLHKEERKLAIQNCYNALKVGGLFMSFENYAPESELGEKLYLHRWKRFQLEQGRNLAVCEEHLQRYQKAYFPISLSEHVALLKECGFRMVELVWVSYMQMGILGMK